MPSLAGGLSPGRRFLCSFRVSWALFQEQIKLTDLEGVHWCWAFPYEAACFFLTLTSMSHVTWTLCPTTRISALRLIYRVSPPIPLVSDKPGPGRHMCPGEACFNSSSYREAVSFWRLVFSGYMPSSGIAGSYGSVIPSILRILQSGCINSHSYQPCKMVFPLSLHPFQHFLFVIFWWWPFSWVWGISSL